MDLELTAKLVSVGVSLFGLWILFYWPYRHYRRDLLRARLFSVRARLFDLAADGKISFDHPAYGMLRTTINGMIRFGHNLNLPGAVIWAYAGPPLPDHQGGSFDERFANAIEGLPCDTERELRNILFYVNLSILEHIVFTSLLLVLTIVPVVFVVAVRKLMKITADWLRLALTNSFVDRLDRAALAEGQ